MEALVKLTQSFLGFKVKKSVILQQRNSLFKLLLFINVPNLIILWLVNKHVSEPYMDQTFHYGQLSRYVAGEWAVWDSKITTPPGLYYVQYVMGLIFGTSLSTIRILNCLIFGNLFAVFTMKIFQFKDHNKNNLSRTLNILLTPTIYFFFFLDYTDTLSIALITMAFYYSLVSSQWRLWIVSLLAVYVRQNNIIWIMYILLYRIFTDYAVSISSIRGNVLQSMFGFVKLMFINKFNIVRNNSLQLSIFPIFVGYLYYYNNGKLTFGDHDNHTFTFHPTQILYLSVFIIVNMPLTLGDYFLTFRQTCNRLYYSRHNLAAYLFMLATSLFVVDKFTMVHPFILADNRHYIFYIYRYFQLLKYPMCLIYPLCFNFMVRVIVNCREKLVKYILWLFISVLFLMGSQLVEFRYFAIPFLMLTFQITNKTLHIDVQKIHGSRHNIIGASHRMIWSNIWKFVFNMVIFYVFLDQPFGPDLKSRFMW